MITSGIIVMHGRHGVRESLLIHATNGHVIGAVVPTVLMLRPGTIADVHVVIRTLRGSMSQKSRICSHKFRQAISVRDLST